MDLFRLFQRPKKDDLFNKYPDGVFIVSLEGRILDANNKAIELFGYSRFEMVGEFFSAYVDGGSNLLNKIVSSKKPSISKVKTAFDDDEHFFEISASRDTQNQKVYVTLRDVTQNYKMQNMVNGQFEIAKSIIDEKNNYLVNISGEVLSSLASIEGFSKALSDGVGGVLVDKQMKYVNIINKNAHDLSYDLEKLFTLFRLESGLYEYEFRNFDLVNLLNSIIKRYAPIFEKRRMVFESHFDSLNSRACYLDASVLEYIVKNILDIFVNNVQVGKITLNAGNPPAAFLEKHEFEGKVNDNPNSYVLFEVKASDLVLEEEELAELFDAYTHSNKVKRPIGMKLAFVLIKKFVKYFKGDVWVYSKKSFGTMVSFVLPVEKNKKFN